MHRKPDVGTEKWIISSGIHNTHPTYKTAQVTGKALDTMHYHAQGYLETAYKMSGILDGFFFYHSSL